MKSTRKTFRDFISSLRKKRTKKKRQEMYADTHSLLWVWEFSKKAVLICFFFYVAVQIYAMTVMAVYTDFTYLGALIEQTGNIVRDCVFAYLIKAGVENIGKIWFTDKTSGAEDNSDEAVG